MRAIQLYTPGDIRVDEVSKPTPAADEILLKIAACGICASDHMFNGMGSLFGPDTAMPLGHEFSGIVECVGDNIVGIESGMRVTVDPMAKDNLIGCGGSEGAFAEYLIVKKAELNVNVFILPENVNFDFAALVEPLSVAMHAVNIADPKPGEKVAVLGTGPIGLGAVAALKARGITDIAAIDASDFRLDLAKQLGANATHNATTGKTSRFLGEVHGRDSGEGSVAGRGVDTDVFIDAAGLPFVMTDTIKMAKYQARITVVAMHKEPVPVDFSMVVAKELRFQGAIGYPTEFGEVVKTIAENKIDLEPLITHRFGIEEFSTAFDISKQVDQAGKVLITFPI